MRTFGRSDEGTVKTIKVMQHENAKCRTHHGVYCLPGRMRLSQRRLAHCPKLETHVGRKQAHPGEQQLLD